MKITLDWDEYTFSELEEIENITGEPYTSTWRSIAEGRASVKAWIALVYVNEKRRNPKFTLEMARRVDHSDLEFDTPDDAGNPTETGGDS